jgi:outer membrane lipoprotein SlyB
MEAVRTKRLHPLLTVAAISVTIFSAAGVAALTGVLPHSVGSSREAAPSALVAAPDAAAAAAIATSPSDPAPAPAPIASRPAPVESSAMPPAASVSTPKQAKKHVARAAVPQSVPRPAQPVPFQDFGEAPRIAQAPVQIEAPKPVPAGMLGVVESVLELKQPAEKSNGVGPIAGGIAGAVLGNQFGKGMTRNVITVVGAAGGALAGTAIEKNVRATKHWAITVRLDDGSYSTINSDVEPFWHGGERVRLLDGKLQPA